MRICVVPGGGAPDSRGLDASVEVRYYCSA
jgi:hypothetical protein